jgi:hypothetical protein
VLIIAPTKSIPPNNQNQLSSEPKSSKSGDKPEKVQFEIDLFTAEYLQYTIGGSGDLTDLSTDEHLRGAT